MGSSVKDVLTTVAIVGLSFLAPGSQAFTWTLLAKRVAFTLISQRVMEALAPDQAVFDNTVNSAKVTKSGTNQNIPVLYGQAVVGGTVVYLNITGASNEYLHLVYVLSEGECDSLVGITMDDVDYLDAKFAGLVDVYFMNGTDSQAAEPNCVANNTEWTTDHKLSGICYCYIRLKYDTDAFGGIPNMEFELKGRKVYDPRNGVTAWSDNAALCIADYLNNDRFGRGLSYDDIDIIDSANYIDFGSGSLYTVNGLVNTAATTFDNTKALLTSCRGSLIHRLGKYVLDVDQPDYTSVTELEFNEDTYLQNGITIDIRDKKRLVNTVKVSFNDRSTDYEANTIVIQSANALAVDGTPLEVHLSLPFTTSSAMARRIGTVELNRNRLNLFVDVTLPIAYIMLEVGDIVGLNYDLAGWEDKRFQILSVEINNDEVNLQLQEYLADVHDTALGGSSVLEYDPAPDTDTLTDNIGYISQGGPSIPPPLGTMSCGDGFSYVMHLWEPVGQTITFTGTDFRTYSPSYPTNDGVEIFDETNASPWTPTFGSIQGGPTWDICGGSVWSSSTKPASEWVRYPFIDTDISWGGFNHLFEPTTLGPTVTMTNLNPGEQYAVTWEDPVTGYSMDEFKVVAWDPAAGGSEADASTHLTRTFDWHITGGATYPAGT